MHTSKKNYSVLKDVRGYLGRTCFTFRGECLSPDDTQLMRTSLSYWYSLGCDLLPIDQMSYFSRWLKTMKRMDVYEFGRFLSSVDVSFKEYAKLFETTGVVWDIQSFKRSVPERGYWGAIAPVYPQLKDYLEQPRAHEFRILNQWINFIRRINLRDLDLTAEMEEDYIAFEDSIVSDGQSETLCSELNQVMRTWFSRYNPFTDFKPKHGPGSVAGLKGRHTNYTKYSYIATDQRLEYLQRELGDLSDYFPLAPVNVLDRVSEIVCVPKSMITNRVISKEPVTLQYFQQGVLRWIEEYVEQHPVLRRYISFRHQELSADLARRGSLFGEYATIDLSAASDSVTFDMVKRVFAGTWLLPYLVCTRSDATILPSGRKCKLKKFAPMGSAVCFPVETLIFTACCELARRKCGVNSYFRVFGDDIVISQTLVDALMQILEGLHFKVNKTKSFWGTTLLNFREACGGEYFNGYEVTPIRISRGFCAKSRLTINHADEIQQYISFANKAYDAGFLQLRKEILIDLKNSLPRTVYEKLIYSTNGKYGITTFPDSATNYRLSSRHNTALSKKEVKGIVPKSIVPKEACNRCLQNCQGNLAATCDDTRYFEWLRDYGYRDLQPQSVARERLRICPAVSVMRTAWIPTEYL